MLESILWLNHGHQRKLFQLLSQPSTATQLSRQTGIHFDECNYFLVKLTALKLARCINPAASRSRLYWLTRFGRAWQRRLRELDGLRPIGHDYPDLDWTLYGSVCYSHRAAVIRSLDQPMQPAQIKRRSRSQNPSIQMSANNARDVIRFLHTQGVVRPVSFRKKAHPCYELTEVGKQIQRLLMQAEVRK